MSEQRTIVVTISRQVASGGAYVGYLVAKELGYRYIEREILVQAAQELGVDSAALSKVEERKTGFLEELVKGFVFGTPEAAYVPPTRRPVYDNELFQVESRIIRTFAERYNAVIVGRGGNAVLRGRPGVVNVLIHASLDFRTRRLQQFHELSADEARGEIEEADLNREKFLKTMTGTDWYDARNYHLAIDSGAVGFDAAREMIIKVVENKARELGLQPMH